MLTDYWRDLLSLGGFLLTLLGLYYAIAQIKKTKTAVEATEAATERAVAEARENFLRYAAAMSRMLLNEATLHIRHEDYGKASLRLGDLNLDSLVDAYFKPFAGGR